MNATTGTPQSDATSMRKIPDPLPWAAVNSARNSIGRPASSTSSCLAGIRNRTSRDGCATTSGEPHSTKAKYDDSRLRRKRIAWQI
ncbi:hypothetical protein [uncultured Alistipes sp.]|uniref:hypothetical protein n=1 Tax=uncultured Alistipes sp. TaxID=538949 RepID=UPI0026233E50|nr:hypothetical protein [uncultured Alistipes sp.]